ncbi:dCTP deaminase domain-containing protein [Microbacterium sp. NPDC077663]|uniref:dCTP deaminase n=1 Tax=Microbacterium sp. NPDC077663 TaxID=3364189 RepID=UPI0037C59F89
MILTGPQITRCVADGTITIDPFDPASVNPNSYNYRLGDTLLVSRDEVFDAARSPTWKEFEIPEEGFTLRAGRLYLASTLETIGSSEYVTSLIGRSSLGRLGLFLQVTADLGHVGAVHRWTLELHAVQPLRIYRGMRIGQVSFWESRGSVLRYVGRYSDFSVPTPNLGGLVTTGRPA